MVEVMALTRIDSANLVRWLAPPMPPDEFGPFGNARSADSLAVE
jgi:hypothetical protein